MAETPIAAASCRSETPAASRMRRRSGPGGSCRCERSCSRRASVRSSVYDDERPEALHAWVNFRRAADGHWKTIALFCLEPTPEALRSLPLHRIEVAANAGGSISEQLAARLDEPPPTIGSAEFREAFSGWVQPEPALELRRPPGRRLDDDWYVKVGATYIAAKDRGLKPRTAIAELAGVSTDVAGRWIYEARKRGHLPPTRPGRVSAHG